MTLDFSAGFASAIRDVVRRACAVRGLTIGDFAAALGVHRNAVSGTAHRAEIGLELIARLAREARLTPEDFVALERAWFRARAEAAAGCPRSLAAARVAVLLDQLDDLERFLAARGLEADFRRATKDGAQLRAARAELSAEI